MIVYRVEDPSGVGPYRGGSIVEPFSNERPRPLTDPAFNLLGKEDYFCFTSREDLDNWFDEDRRISLRGKYSILTIESNHVLIGNKQAVFDKSRPYDIMEREAL